MNVRLIEKTGQKRLNKKATFFNKNTASRIWVSLFLAFGYGGYLLLATIANIYNCQNDNLHLFRKPIINSEISKAVFNLAKYHFLIVVAMLILIIINSFLLAQMQSELTNAKNRICWEKYPYPKWINFFFNFSILCVACLPLFLFVLTGKWTYLEKWYYSIAISMIIFIAFAIKRIKTTHNKKRSTTSIVSFIFVELIITAIIISLEYIVFFYAWILIGLLLAIVITTDVGAWFAGSLIGKTKITKISPNKSYQGLIFGGITACLIAVLYCYLVFYKLFNQDIHENWHFLLIISCVAIILSLVAQGSDICFSSIKREAKIKDFSGIFKSHGGVLDRFDGFIGCYLFGAMLLGFILYYFPQ